MQANTINDRSNSWSASAVPVLKAGSVKVLINGIKKSSLALMLGIS